MKTKILTNVVLALLLSGSFISCKNKSEDIDMSEIDFSNIEDLYKQPLPVIKKCVQGKWKWYVSIGGYVEVSYSDHTFIDIKDDHYVVEYEDGSQDTLNFTWKKHSANLLDIGEHKTYSMWDKERNEAGWYFISIKNDTLRVGSDLKCCDIPYEFGFVRIE